MRVQGASEILCRLVHDNVFKCLKIFIEMKEHTYIRISNHAYGAEQGRCFFLSQL